MTKVFEDIRWVAFVSSVSQIPHCASTRGVLKLISGNKHRSIKVTCSASVQGKSWAQGRTPLQGGSPENLVFPGSGDWRMAYGANSLVKPSPHQCSPKGGYEK